MESREEFASLQRRDAEGTLDDAGEMRLRALWQHHGDSWMRDDLGFGREPVSGREVVYRDGYPHTVEMSLAEAIERRDRLGELPIHTLRLTGIDGRLVSLAGTPLLRKLVRLDLGYGLERLTCAEIVRFFSSSGLDAIEEVALSPHENVPDAWDGLEVLPRLGELKSLGLYSVEVWPEFGAWLGRSLPKLEVLDCHASLTGAALRSLTKNATFRLRELRLSDKDGQYGRTPLLDEGAIAEALRSPMTETLTTLSLFGCHLRARAVSLDALPCASRLVSLDVGSQGSPAIVRDLARCAFPSLRSLNIRDNLLTDRDLDVVARFPTLRALRVEKNALSSRSLRAISGLHDLRRLNLADCPIGDEGAPLVAENGNLRSLNLSHTGLTEHGVRAVVKADGLRDLRELNVVLNELGKRGVRLLADSPFEKMAVLSVGYTMKGDPAPLFEDAWLPYRESTLDQEKYERKLEPSGAPAVHAGLPRD